MPTTYELTDLQALEAEAIHIIREVAAEFERPVLLFSGGKARAKERVFSFRDDFGQWDPKNQRPELWNLYNGRHRPGEHIRVFPLSNWTELDIWQYVAVEQIELPPIYFAHRRRVFQRDGMWLAENPWTP